MFVLLFLAFAVGLFLGYWMGKKDSEEMDEAETLRERIIADLDGYLRNKPALSAFEVSLKNKLAHLREMW